MKRIIKQSPPRSLKTWFDSTPIGDNGIRYNCDYKKSLPTEVKHEIQESLLAEQGHLCCYTGIRITLDQSHIEHFKPQSESRNSRSNAIEDYDDTSYTNMFAAYPRDDLEKDYTFGAKKRGNQLLPISPLDFNCEQRFRFTLFGKVEPASASDTEARVTIDILALDHESLNDMRKQAIEEALYRKNRPLSEKQLESLIGSYCEADTHSNQMRPFCFVIQQAAQDLLDRLKKKRDKKKYRKKSK